MCGTVTYRRMADGSEKMYKNYRCNFKAQSKLCDRSKTYREADLEEYMLAHIRPALSDYIAKYEVTAASTVQKNPVTEIAKIERKMKKLYDLFMDDLIDKEAYRSEYDKFKAQIEELQSVRLLPLAKPWQCEEAVVRKIGKPYTIHFQIRKEHVLEVVC